MSNINPHFPSVLRRISLAVALGLSLSLPLQAQDVQIPWGQGGRYYIDGAAAGADALAPKSTYSSRFSVGINPRAGLVNDCGSLDFYANFEAELKNLQWKLKNTVKNAQAAIMSSVSGAISSFFQYQLMKINPTLGQLTTKQLDEYMELFNLQVRQCEDYERDAANGKNPLDEIIHIAVGEEWKYTIGRVGLKEISLDEAKQMMIDEARKKGVTMPDGRNYGGNGQDPINYLKSLVIAGMNLDMGRSDKSSWHEEFPHSSEDIALNPILNEFKSPEELFAFAEEIYGSQTFRIGTDVSNQSEHVRSVPGRGYEEKYLEYRNSYAQDLRAYVSGQIDQKTFQSRQRHIIPPIEINDIRKMAPFEKDMDIDSRAQNFAINRLKENLIYLKQALKTGMHAPDLQGSAVRQPVEQVYKLIYYQTLDDIREISL